MGQDKEQRENLATAAACGPAPVWRDVARLSEDGLSVEIARFVGAELIEVRAVDPAQALRQAAAISDAAGQALINRARLGLARSIA